MASDAKQNRTVPLSAFFIAVILSAVWTLWIICFPGCRNGQDAYPNILLVSIDTLRADHLGCYGYARNTSPTLDLLAEEGVRFEQAISASPWTLPSHMSIMTSLYPEQHKRAWKNLFPDVKLTTLADVLSAHGYKTQGFVAVPFLKDVYGFAQGFSGYAFQNDIDAAGQTDKVIAWMDRLDQMGNPFFLFVHYFDPHAPYMAPEPYRLRFTADMAELSPDINVFKKTLTEEERLFIQALYDAEIRYTDDHLGRLLAAFREKSDSENSVILVVSDHGEEFWDHGGVDHGHTLYDELIRVPLIISAPGRFPERRVVKETVRTIDLMPTILSLSGIPVPDTCQGISLLKIIREGTSPGPSAFSSSMVKGPEKKSIRTDGHKLIYNTLTLKSSLYDLKKDPGEQHNIFKGEQNISETLRMEMENFMKTSLLAWQLLIVPDNERSYSGEISTGGVFLEVEARRLQGEKPANKPAGKQKTLLMLPVKELEKEGKEVTHDISLSDDRKTLNFVFPPGRSPLLISFNTSPKDAPITCTFLLNGQPEHNMVFLGPERQASASAVFTADPEKLEVQDQVPLSSMKTKGYYLWKIAMPEETGGEVSLDRETVEQLHALGYMDVTQ